jgi:DNA processing protein
MTTQWNLDTAQIDRAMSALRPGDDEPERRRAFAAAAWSFLVEPGDRIAGALVRERGAEAALAAVIARPAASTLANDEINATEVAEALARWEPRLDSAALFRALATAESIAATIVTPGDEQWSSGLNDLGDHAPHVLWVRGNVDALPQLANAVSIVGARASTGYGEHVAMDFAAGFSARGYTVVSGGAYGIDGMAHRAAIACGGTTVAVLAGGVDQLYPSGHDELLRRIVATGAVVSEVSPGGAPTRWRFLQRNRLIAAMSGVTVVVEAGYRSGSLNTATHARDLDRPVAVIPGPITSGSSAGCHRLIRTNPAATLVTSVSEVLELMSGELHDGATVPADGSNAIRVLDALSNSRARSVELIAARSGLAIGDVTATLGTLALEGRAISTDDGWRKNL